MRTNSITTNIRAIWISPGHDFVGRKDIGRLDHGVESHDAIECHAGKGIVGDRYYDTRHDYKGQITFFDAAIADKLKSALKLETIEPSRFRRNVLLEGIDLNSLIGMRFTLGDIEFSGSEECRPCFWMNEAIAPGAHDWLKGHGGLRCRIHTSGTLHAGQAPLAVLGPVEQAR